MNIDGQATVRERPCKRERDGRLRFTESVTASPAVSAIPIRKTADGPTLMVLLDWSKSKGHLVARNKKREVLFFEVSYDGSAYMLMEALGTKDIKPMMHISHVNVGTQQGVSTN